MVSSCSTTGCGGGAIRSGVTSDENDSLPARTILHRPMLDRVPIVVPRAAASPAAAETEGRGSMRRRLFRTQTCMSADF